MTLGDRLITLRKENGYSIRKSLAEELEMPETTLRNYEKNVREPGHSFLIRISEKFNVSIDWLLGVSDDREIRDSYQLKSSEYSLIEKYRVLDPAGRDHVNTVIEWESNRVEQIADLENQLTDEKDITDFRRQLEEERLSKKSGVCSTINKKEA